MNFTSMGFDIQSIFTPSVGADLVLDMDSLTPVSRSTIIYDADYKKQHITVAQPLLPITPGTRFDQLHLTTIIAGPQRRVRIGIACRPDTFINNYRLANNTTAKAIRLKYTPPAIETNIRSAFRLPLSTKYAIKAKLLFNEGEYYTARDFSIRDISLNGMGLVIPKLIKKAVNPLTSLEVNDVLPIGMILVDKTKDTPLGTFPVRTQVKRMNQNYSQAHALAGLKITRITQKHEDALNQFIHNAQIEELKRLRVKRI